MSNESKTHPFAKIADILKSTKNGGGLTVHNDLTFFTNEPERDLYSRFSTILRSNTQFFDILLNERRYGGC